MGERRVGIRHRFYLNFVSQSLLHSRAVFFFLFSLCPNFQSTLLVCHTRMHTPNNEVWPHTCLAAFAVRTSRLLRAYTRECVHYSRFNWALRYTDFGANKIYTIKYVHFMFCFYSSGYKRFLRWWWARMDAVAMKRGAKRARKELHRQGRGCRLDGGSETVLYI